MTAHAVTVSGPEFWLLLGSGFAMGVAATLAVARLLANAPRGEDLWPDDDPEHFRMQLPPRVTRPARSHCTVHLVPVGGEDEGLRGAA